LTEQLYRGDLNMKKYFDFVVIGGLAGLFLWTYVVLPLVFHHA